jgi:hypothetical protein
MSEIQNDVDQELQAAQAALAAAQKRKGEAEAAALAKLRIQIAEQEAEAQRKLREEHEARERKLEEIRKETARKAEQRSLEAAVARAQAEQLQRELSEREQAVKAEADRQEAIRKVQEQAFAVEQEAKRIEADLIRGKSAVNELALDQNRPSGIHDPRNPISRMFGTERVPENAFVAPLVEQAKQSPLRDVLPDEITALYQRVITDGSLRIDRGEINNMLARVEPSVLEPILDCVLAENRLKRFSAIEFVTRMQQLVSERAQ